MNVDILSAIYRIKIMRKGEYPDVELSAQVLLNCVGESDGCCDTTCTYW